MRNVQSSYMHWAKFKTPVRYALTASEVPHFRLDSLPIGVPDLDMDGASHPRYRPLRERVAARYGVTVDQVVTADGTSMANWLAMATILSPGDEVLVERPTYEPLLAALSFIGANIVRFDRNSADAFRLECDCVERALSPKTRLIVITNLHNPSGTLAPEPELRRIGKLATGVGARVLVDEVYLDSAVPPGSTAAHLGPEFVITNSLTKVYGLSGLRCGWVLSEPELAERMWRVNDLFGVNQAHQAERLACFAFDRIADVIGDTPALLEHNRAIFNEFVRERPDLQCSPAQHGITAFPCWRGGNTQKLDELLRERYDTSVVPGHWFEMADHFRVGFGLPRTDFETAISRLRAALDELK